MAERANGAPGPAPLPADRLREALGEPEPGGRVRAEPFAGVSIDSRAVRPGCLFVGVRGERHDGSAFAEQAVRAGAAGVVAPRPRPASLGPEVPWWRVPDGGEALRRIAFVHRRSVRARVVCVTGSNGKTGTKELIAAVLAQRFTVARTRGNLNNLIGLPLSLLELGPEHDWGVFEIGTNRPGEIATLAALAAPDVGVVTNVAASHLEGLGSLEGVVREKTDLAAALGARGILVYGGDGELLRSAVRAFSCVKVSYGLDPENDVRPEQWELDAEGRPVFQVAGVGEVRLPLVGVPNLLNALAALVVGRLAGVAPAQIRRALESVAALPMRLEVERVGGVTVIQDCYNANPESVRSGVQTLRLLGRAGDRVAVLGAMRELGAEAEALHYALGRELAGAPLDMLVVYGEEAVPLARGYQSGTGAAVHLFHDPSALARFLRERVAGPATVLFKASRGVALEEAARAYLGALRGEDAQATGGDGELG